MSGFVGLLARDGRPVDAAELDARVATIAFRGPDGTHAWRAGHVGLGHARLVTDPARDGEVQPLTLDGLTLTGHIRLDGREPASDAARVLAAYRQWGPDCVHHLHGDFSFAIWDAREQRLFCARDRFGVRPFFYAATDAAFLFGNTLASLRAHPGVDLALDETALADFLAFGYSQELERTFFAGIRRLPPAHTLVVTARELVVKRYWSLPVEPELRHADAGDYVDEFVDLLGRAVADRTPPGNVALHLSGGLDSGGIAAALARNPGAKGFCIGWNSAFADPEPGFARLTAEALGLPLSVYEEPDCEPLKDAAVEPEPSYDIYRQLTVDALQPVAAHARVALDGQGGDELFQPEFLLDEWRRAPSLRVLADFLRAWRTTGARPPLGLRAARPAPPEIPDWIAVSWRRAQNLDERARDLATARPDHRLPHARARARLGAAVWQPYFESYDAGLTRTAVEVRWPLLDERLVRFVLRVPPLPWCLDKHLQRRALRGRLPRAITERPKAPLAADPVNVFLDRQPHWPDAHRWIKPWLAGRIDLGAWLHSLQRPPWTTSRWAHIRAVGLAVWLRRQASPAGTL